MLKQLTTFSLLTIIALGTVACGEDEKQEQINELNEKIERLEAREDVLLEDTDINIDNIDEDIDDLKGKDAAILRAEIERLKLEREQAERARKEAEEKAKQEAAKPTPPAPKPQPKPQPTSNVGPGNGNNTQGPSQGNLTIRTKTVNGVVNIRENPSTNSNDITSRPNGYNQITYSGYQQVGDYVWYNVEIPNDQGGYDTGWIRGDYVDRQ